MTNLAYSIFQDIAETETQKDEPHVFSFILPSEKKDSETNIILGSTAGDLLVDPISFGLGPQLVTISSGSQQNEIYATGIYIDKSMSVEYGDLGVFSGVFPAINLETEARNESAEIFSFADGYLQHDGISDLLYSKIEELFDKYDDLATNAIKDLFDNENINLEIINDSLSIIGDLMHPETASSRLKLLEHYLFSSSHYIRDGAILGIANTNDSSAIKSLNKALESEGLSEIRKDIQKVISLLKEYGIHSRN